LLLLAFSAWQSTRLTFDGDLRSMNMVSPTLHNTEKSLQQIWGDLRGRAIAFVEGNDLETALAGNEQLFAYLTSQLPPGDIISLAPVLASKATRQHNRAQWEAFWQTPQGTELLLSMEREGERIGFSRQAFAPFRQICSEVATESGRYDPVLGGLTEALVVREETRVRILTLLPDTALVANLFDDAAALPQGARLVSQRHFNSLISSAIGSDFRQYLLYTLLVVTGVVVVIFRSPRKILLTLVPVLTGMLVMTGGMGLFGIPFNLFNIVATVLVIGLCIDYGIYMVCRLTEGADYDADRAVLVSGLTTLAGFGVLVMASHPALHSIGVTVLFGIGAAIPAALLVIPVLERR
jgi:predicted exporter